MIQVEDVAALHPNGTPNGRELARVRIRVGRARRFRIRLADGPHADRLDDEVAELLALICSGQQMTVGVIQGHENVQIAVGLMADGLDDAGDPDTGQQDLEPRRVVDVAVLIGRPARRRCRPRRRLLRRVRLRRRLGRR